MKNFYLTGALILLVAFSVSAQLVEPTNKMDFLNADENVQKVNPATVHQVGPHLTNNDRAVIDTLTGWVNFPEAHSSYLQVGSISTLSAMWLFSDSLVKTVYNDNGAPNFYHQRWHVYAQSFDPSSVIFAEGYDYAEWFNENNSFHLDSLAFGYMYKRLDDSATDTIVVRLYNGNQTGGYNLTDGTFAGMVPFYDSLSQSTTSVPFHTYEILLTADDTTSDSNPSTGSNWAMKVVNLTDITPNIVLEDRNQNDMFVVASFEYKSGSTYNLGDTLLDFNATPQHSTVKGNKLNRFALVCYEENDGLEPNSWEEDFNDFDRNTFNWGSVLFRELKYAQIDFGGYAHTRLWTPGYSYEHAYVAYHLDKVFGAMYDFTKAGLTVNFEDASNFGPTSWQWAFGENGLLGVSTDQNPSYTFPEPGTYEVCLNAQKGNQVYSYCDDVTVAFPFSIGEVEKLAAIQVYPNPASDMIALDLGEVELDDIQLSLANILGETVEATILATKGNKVILDASVLPSGTYNLIISTTDAATTKTVVVQ